MMLPSYFHRSAKTTTRRFFVVATFVLPGVSHQATAQQNAAERKYALTPVQSEAEQRTASQQSPTPQVTTPQAAGGTSNLQRVAPAKSAAPTPRVLAPAISRADRELIEAAFAGETWKTREALSRGAKIEARDFGYNWTPLMWASLKGHVGTVRYLLSRGANANALGGGDRRMVLLNLGREYSQTAPVGAAAPNATLITRSGFFIANANTTALLLAASGGYGMTVEALLSKGANPNLAAASGDAPLAGAAYSGNLAAVEALLSEGAKIETRDSQGGTALVSAVLEGHTEVVRALLKRGANTGVKWRNISLADLAKARGYGEVSRLLKIASSKTPIANRRAKNVATSSGNGVKILN